MYSFEEKVHTGGGGDLSAKNLKKKKFIFYTTHDVKVNSSLTSYILHNTHVMQGPIITQMDIWPKHHMHLE